MALGPGFTPQNNLDVTDVALGLGAKGRGNRLKLVNYGGFVRFEFTVSVREEISCTTAATAFPSLFVVLRIQDNLDRTSHASIRLPSAYRPVFRADDLPLICRAQPLRQCRSLRTQESDRHGSPGKERLHRRKEARDVRFRYALSSGLRTAARCRAAHADLLRGLSKPSCRFAHGIRPRRSAEHTSE